MRGGHLDARAHGHFEEEFAEPKLRKVGTFCQGMLEFEQSGPEVGLAEEIDLVKKGGRGVGVSILLLGRTILSRNFSSKSLR